MRIIRMAKIAEMEMTRIFIVVIGLVSWNFLIFDQILSKFRSVSVSSPDAIVMASFSFSGGSSMKDLNDGFMVCPSFRATQFLFNRNLPYGSFSVIDCLLSPLFLELEHSSFSVVVVFALCA